MALALGLETRGWVPRGRWAEDGALDARYPGLLETQEAEPTVRTRRNVEDSAALLVLSFGAATGGTALALEVARELGRPTLVVDLDRAEVAAVRAFLAAHASVNVAGPRASEAPRGYAAARALLEAALTPPPAP